MASWQYDAQCNVIIVMAGLSINLALFILAQVLFYVLFLDYVPQSKIFNLCVIIILCSL